MIYITGDTHGDKARFIENNIGDDSWTEQDYLIICGDFGYIFLNDAYEKSVLEILKQKPYTICFCDGNHENFPAIFSYPQEQWNGGKIHRIAPNIIHLMRGQVFDIEGKKIFTMGGAYSIDKHLRKTGYDHWDEELPTMEEYDEARENLAKNQNRVDIVITHTAPTTAINLLGASGTPEEQSLASFLDYLMHNLSYDKWYFGHWHVDKAVTDKLTAVYYRVYCVE
ncbi:MAG: metallophosphoesterase [Oscillospiraceae bacterium]|nr:metallophosphoesterase [Oscillospiraceae bacterium]